MLIRLFTRHIPNGLRGIQVKKSKIILAIIVVIVISAFFLFDFHQYFTFDYFQRQKNILDELVLQEPVISGLVFFSLYVLIAALSLPGAAIMTLAAGALFGLLWGTFLASFASTIGASLAFLISRFLFRDYVQRRFHRQMQIVNEEIDREGAYYLFTLRLILVFPFFVVNLVMGLTKIQVWTFFWVSQLGMLAGSIIYVNAGTQLAKLDSLQGILSPPLLLSFILLGLFPLLAKRVIEEIKHHKVLRRYNKPLRFDRNLVVIGAGSAGLVAAYIAATVKAKVTLIEKHKMGGDCLNTGCVPSKALIRSAKFAADVKRAKNLGFARVDMDFNFADVMDRVHKIIKRIEPHDSVERYTKLGVECVQGEASITSPYTVEVNGKTITTRAIVVATGARPFVPPIAGLDQVKYLTSDSVWSLNELPQRLVVLGGGPIGCEMAQAFSRLGSAVMLVEMGDRIMPREDEDVSVHLVARFKNEGIRVRTGHTAKVIKIEDGEKWLVCDNYGKNEKIAFDEILIAIGRKANTAGLGLDELGIRLRQNGTIETNEYLQTSIPTIFASGDVTGPYQFTHTAAHQSWYSSVNALFGFVKKFKVDYSVIPWTTFVDPEIARVGLNVQEAKEKGVEHEVTVFGFPELDRAITDEADHGFIKVLTVPGKDRILGVTIFGEHAGELISEFVLAMKQGIGLNKILGTIHAYPTMTEVNKYVAGKWRRNHAPERILQWAARIHDLRRGKPEVTFESNNSTRKKLLEALTSDE
ncbi:MAG: FAD-dependent oxidoreductase [Gammaproteobacteria bacterium]|nr:FAD-dependent oxidoreductase [Gammaproteobacteria bacterium]